jgi:hypothetical protein
MSGHTAVPTDHVLLADLQAVPLIPHPSVAPSIGRSRTRQCPLAKQHRLPPLGPLDERALAGTRRSAATARWGPTVGLRPQPAPPSRCRRSKSSLCGSTHPLTSNFRHGPRGPESLGTPRWQEPEDYACARSQHSRVDRTHRREHPLVARGSPRCQRTGASRPRRIQRAVRVVEEVVVLGQPQHTVAAEVITLPSRVLPVSDRRPAAGRLNDQLNRPRLGRDTELAERGRQGQRCVNAVVRSGSRGVEPVQVRQQPDRQPVRRRSHHDHRDELRGGLTKRANGARSATAWTRTSGRRLPLFRLTPPRFRHDQQSMSESRPDAGGAHTQLRQSESFRPVRGRMTSREWPRRGKHCKGKGR